MTTPAKKKAVKKSPAAKKSPAKKIEPAQETVTAGKTAATETTGETNQAVEESKPVAKKKKAKKPLTEAAQARLDKAKAKAKEVKAKEKAVLAKAEDIKALAAIEVDSKDITAAKAAFKRVGSVSTKLRADWIIIGDVLSKGKSQCLKEDNTVNNVLFGKWVEAKGLDIIPNNKRSDIIWLAEYNAAMQTVLSEEVLEVINEFNSPSHIKSAVRALNDETLPEEKRLLLGLTPKALGGPSEKAVKDANTRTFDAHKFADTLAEGIVEHYLYASEDYEYLYSKLKAALSAVKAAAEGAGETVGEDDDESEEG